MARMSTREVSARLASAAIVCAAVSSVVVNAPAASAQAYQVIDVQMGAAYGINNQGTVCGRLSATNTAGIWKNFITTNFGTLGGSQSFADKVNESDQATGWSLDALGARKAYFWNGATMVNLGALISGGESDGRDVNDLGQVVGSSDVNPPAETRPFRWQNGIMTQLPSFGGTYAAAEAINNAGVIAGWSDQNSSTSSRRAFVYSNGILTNLGTLVGPSVANDINDNGEVVGRAENGSGVDRAVKFQNGQVINLGGLAGNRDSYAVSINNNGQIVGWGYDANGGYEALRYEPTGPVRLNTLISPASGWDLWWAEDINDKGEIAGYGNQNGTNKGFLLRPIQLVLSGPFPGLVGQNNDFLVDNAVPGARVYLLYGTQRGSTPIPNYCYGVSLDMRAPTVGGSAIANANGDATITGFTPNGAKGRTILYQLLELTSCRKSNLVAYTYP